MDDLYHESIIICLKIFHHRIDNFLPLLFQILTFIISFLHSPLFVHRRQQHLSLLIFLNLCYSRIRIIISPFYCQHLILIKCLVSHCLFRKLCHTSMSEFDKCITFVRKNIDILYLSPHWKMSKQNFVHLDHSLLSVWQTILTDEKSFSLFGEATNSFHVFSKTTKTWSSKNILSLINALTIFNWRYFVIVPAVNSIGTASSGKEKTVVCSSFLIEQIGSSIPNIKLWIASG